MFLPNEFAILSVEDAVKLNGFIKDMMHLKKMTQGAIHDVATKHGIGSIQWDLREFIDANSQYQNELKHLRTEDFQRSEE